MLSTRLITVIGGARACPSRFNGSGRPGPLGEVANPGGMVDEAGTGDSLLGIFEGRFPTIRVCPWSEDWRWRGGAVRLVKLRVGGGPPTMRPLRASMDTKGCGSQSSSLDRQLPSIGPSSRIDAHVRLVTSSPRSHRTQSHARRGVGGGMLGHRRRELGFWAPEQDAMIAAFLAHRPGAVRAVAGTAAGGGPRGVEYRNPAHRRDGFDGWVVAKLKGADRRAAVGAGDRVSGVGISTAAASRPAKAALTLAARPLTTAGVGCATRKGGSA